MPVVIPEAVLIIGAFFLLACALILRGMLAGYSYSFGSMFAWLAKHLVVRIPLPFGKSVTVNFGSPFGVINDVIVETMQVGIRHTEKYLALTWHAAEKLLRYTVEAIDHLARETAETFDWLAHVKLPRIVKLLAAPLLLPLLLPKIAAYIAAHVKSGTVRIVHTIEHTVTHTTATVVRRTVHAGAAFPPWVIRLPGRVRGLEHDATKLGRRVKRVEGLFAAGVMAAVLANVLGVATRCIRRGNINRAAKAVCGMDSGLLETLLADGLAIVGAISVVEFAEALLTIEDEAVAILSAGIREFPKA